MDNFDLRKYLAEGKLYNTDEYLRSANEYLETRGYNTKLYQL